MLLERPLEKGTTLKTPRSVSTVLGLTALVTALACGSAEGPTSLLDIFPMSPEVEPSGNVQFSATSPAAPDERIAWAVLEPDGGTIDTTGVYTAPEGEGTYTVTASLASLSTTQATSVRVKRNIRVDVSPSAAAIAAGESLALSASVSGSVKTVTWSIAEGAAGGTVTTAGVYTAPQTAGVYHVVATSTVPPTKSGSATITVTTLPAPPPPPTVSIAVSPQVASVVAGNTVQLTAAVTGSTNVGVTWSVQEGAAGGSITTDGVYKAPATAGTYHVVARSVADTTKSATAAVTVTAAPTTAHTWNVTVPPPALSNPTTITLPGNYLGTISHGLCSGPGYQLYLDSTKDYIIRTNSILYAPVQIHGGRNVRIIGLHIDVGNSPCAGSGLSGFVPGTIGLMVSQVGTTFIEGAYIDMRGRSTDCIVARNDIAGGEALSQGYSESAARGARDVVLQNSVCRGMAGDDDIHGDIMQTQGLHELFRNISIENLSVDSNCEGFMLLPRDGYQLANNMMVRRFDYRHDSRYQYNADATGPYRGPAGFLSAKAYSISDVWTNRSIAGDEVIYHYGTPSSRYIAPCDGSTGVNCPAHPPYADRFAAPATGAATDAWTGINYVSPHP